MQGGGEWPATTAQRRHIKTQSQAERKTRDSTKTAWKASSHHHFGVAVTLTSAARVHHHPISCTVRSQHCQSGHNIVCPS